MEKLFDGINNRLIFIGAKADPEFWDAHWSGGPNTEVASREGSAVSCVQAFAAYLTPTDGPILEGGCGNGGPLLALQRHGFSAQGVDYAEKTIAWLQRFRPDLRATKADVRALPFETETFAGYYSGGVIEHFWEGYEQILAEAFRVLKPGGYAIFTFPVMSPTRRLKAGLGLYQRYSSASVAPAGFYQFALRPGSVVSDLGDIGFKVVEVSMRSGVKGLKEEFGYLGRVANGRGVAAKGVRFISRLTQRWCGHSVMVVAEKPSHIRT